MANKKHEWVATWTYRKGQRKVTETYTAATFFTLLGYVRTLLYDHSVKHPKSPGKLNISCDML